MPLRRDPLREMLHALIEANGMMLAELDKIDKFARRTPGCIGQGI